VLYEGNGVFTLRIVACQANEAALRWDPWRLLFFNVPRGFGRTDPTGV